MNSKAYGREAVKILLWSLMVMCISEGCKVHTLLVRLFWDIIAYAILMLRDGVK